MQNNKILFFIYVTILICCFGQTAVFASEKPPKAHAFAEVIDDIVEWSNAAPSIKAGTIFSDWFVIALRQYGGEYDYSAYMTALTDYQNQSANRSATDLQRMALVYGVLDAEVDFVTDTLNQTVGQLGVMSYIYGLILLDSGTYESIYTRDEIIENIIALRLEDGGWALTGSVSDTDITAMAIQALAPYYKQEEITPIIDTALQTLSEKQLPDGDYQSYGARNAESVAQVIVALCALGLDYESDARFIKNGCTLLDGLGLYALPDGSYSHTIGGLPSGMASVQALQAYVALWRQANDLGRLYDFSTDVPIRTTNATPVPAEASKPAIDGKLIAYAAICAVFLISVVCLFVTKRRNIKNILFAAVLTIASLAAIYFVEIQSVEEYYLVHIDDIVPDSKTVWIAIRCDTVAAQTTADHIPLDGVILPATEYVLRDGDTAFDVLLRASKHNKIPLDYDGQNAFGAVYINSIQYIYALAYGDLSGWMFKINGEFPTTACSETILSDGDRMEWVYTLDLGKDVDNE